MAVFLWGELHVVCYIDYPWHTPPVPMFKQKLKAIHLPFNALAKQTQVLIRVIK